MSVQVLPYSGHFGWECSICDEREADYRTRLDAAIAASEHTCPGPDVPLCGRCNTDKPLSTWGRYRGIYCDDCAGAIALERVTKKGSLYVDPEPRKPSRARSRL
jgi:hypothetical protein